MIEGTYNVSKKINDRWKTLGKISINKWGKPQLSFRKTEELTSVIEGSGDWINFALFEDTGEKKAKADPLPGDDIPF